eukprot:CAMPEP_0119548922 /NCGR_PEP_ID=MMETSP1352-20130426/2733_1 /TAXON_ID=265584 /ORGANISM="Stauroneis constricta, Strain CCMP1120" /LENGTH=1250 /DNA_ID=CAMNT_0007594331 /DNA_START=406 /DNA_END=4157 /DNA_ORIENTATION=-
MEYRPPRTDPLLKDYASPESENEGSMAEPFLGSSQTGAGTPGKGRQKREIWDQLDDQEALEVQRHQSRFAPAPMFETRSNPLVVLGSMVGTTVRQAATSTYNHAARIGQQQYQQRVLPQHHSLQNPLQPQQQHAQTQNHNFDSPYQQSAGRHRNPTTSHLNLPQQQQQYHHHQQQQQQSRWNQSQHPPTLASGRYAELPTTLNQDGTAAGGMGIPENDRSSFASLFQSATASALHDSYAQHHDYRSHAFASAPQSPPSANAKSTFLKISPFPQRPENDGWGAVPNVDLFLSQLYHYYYNRGFVPIVCKGMLEITTMSMTLGLSVLLLAYVDWNRVWECHDEDTCLANVQDYLMWTSIWNPSTSSSETASATSQSHSLLFNAWHYIIIPSYISVFGSYTLFAVWKFWQQINEARMARHVLEDKLGFASRKLLGGAVAWEDIVSKLLEVQEAGTFRFMVNYPNTSNGSTPATSPSSSMTTSERHDTTTTTSTTATTNRSMEQSQRQQTPISPPRTTTATLEGHNDGDLTLSPPAKIAADTAALLLSAQLPSQLRESSSAVSTAVAATTAERTTPPMPDHPTFDALEVAQRIMRKDNFLLALWNQGDRILDCDINGRTYFGATMEWSLYFCVLNFMFNHQYQIRPAFTQDYVALQQRLRLVAWMHIIFMPFVILFQIMHFALQNAYEFQRNKTYLGDKEWSRAAKWTFREFNELPHVFDQRLSPSYEAAEAYFGLFGSSEIVSAFGHLLVFLGGATGGVLLILAGMNDALLLHVQYGGRNLVWYAGMAGVTYSVGKALSPSKKQPMVTRNLYRDMNVALETMASHTHYYPDIWRNRGWDSTVHSAVSKLMDSKVKLLMYELASIIVAPYILLCKWSPAAEKICTFCRATSHRLRSPGAGDVCGFSTFDFDLYSDEPWEGRTIVDEENPNGGDNPTIVAMEKSALGDSILQAEEEAMRRPHGNTQGGKATSWNGAPKARHGKMEKSFLSFQVSYPNWKCQSSGGQSLLLRVEEHRQAEYAAALAKERQMHIDVAEKQLETLAYLNQNREHQTQHPMQPMPARQYTPLPRLGTILEGRKDPIAPPPPSEGTEENPGSRGDGQGKAAAPQNLQEKSRGKLAASSATIDMSSRSSLAFNTIPTSPGTIPAMETLRRGSGTMQGPHDEMSPTSSLNTSESTAESKGRPSQQGASQSGGHATSDDPTQSQHESIQKDEQQRVAREIPSASRESGTSQRRTIIGFQVHSGIVNSHAKDEH